jgi:hypothetical protein
MADLGQRKRKQTISPSPQAMAHASKLIFQVCCLAGSFDQITGFRRTATGRQLRKSVALHDTPALFDWLMEILSYQGVSNQAAEAYLERHGNVTHAQIDSALQDNPPCPKLQSYWQFAHCRYDKQSRTCAEPEHIGICPLPHHHLRNGRLNQTAYSLFLFIRDIANDDFVSWIDTSLNRAGSAATPADMQEALVGPLRNIYGVSDKVLTLALSLLMIAAGSDRPRWLAIGCNMIVVDTLVHAFLHRTGILRRCRGDHPYGAACYKPGGCADIIRAVAATTDARQFNSRYPAYFPPSRLRQDSAEPS